MIETVVFKNANYLIHHRNYSFTFETRRSKRLDFNITKRELVHLSVMKEKLQ